MFEHIELLVTVWFMVVYPILSGIWIIYRVNWDQEIEVWELFIYSLPIGFIVFPLFSRLIRRRLRQRLAKIVYTDNFRSAKISRNPRRDPNRTK